VKPSFAVALTRPSIAFAFGAPVARIEVRYTHLAMPPDDALPIGRARSATDTQAPDGSDIRLLATIEHGATRASLCEVTLAAGAISRPVRHRSIEEIWHVTAGRGRVWRCPPGGAAEAVDVSAGDTLVIPPRWAFQFSAAPTAELRFVCYTSPPWPGPEEAEPVEIGALGTPTV
jgi:mannose-6-phosphate isomerase-like protein (cupin superfamily)